MITHEVLRDQALDRADVKIEYDSLELEFTLMHNLLAARKKAGLTQAEVAERMGTHPPAVARLESFNRQHSPSLKTLRKYAEAVGCDLEIKLIPSKH